MRNITNLIILSSLLSVFLIAANPTDDRLINKEYNGMKPLTVGSGCGKLPKDQYDSLEYEAYDIVCQIAYIGHSKVDCSKIKADGSRECNVSQPKVIVQLLSIIDNEKARLYLKREVIAKTNKEIPKYKDKYNNQAEIIIGNSIDYQQEIYWLSAKYIVKIAWHDTQFPHELINDYNQKYPPNYTFTSNDFNVQKILKDDLMIKINNIDEWDSDRGKINRTLFKADEYIAIYMQCKAEMTIRCELGLTDQSGKVNCPAAFNLNDNDRKKAYKELKREINNKNIVTESVNWYHIDEPKCGRSNPDWKLDAQQMLNMDQDDMNEAKKMIKKKIGSPTP